jgi:membrane-bound lytic murein transglycosylase A
MKRKLIYIPIAVACLLLSSLWSSFDKKELHPIVAQQNTTKTKPPEPKVLTAQITPKKVVSSKPLKTVITKNNTLKQVSFDDLPGWNNVEIKKSLLAFQKSCDTFLKQEPNHKVGSQLINLKAKDWHPACKEVLTIDSAHEEQAKIFFEKWFYPIEFAKKPTRSLFTGYYMPQLKGNLTRTAEFNTPIYGKPTQINSQSLPYYTREKIDNGALKNKAPVIAWINSPVERLFLEIEGSGVIKLANGKQVYLGYADENGAPYSSISKVLINKGIMTKDNASKKAIKRYLESQPKKGNELMHENKSFVFFQKLRSLIGLGTQGMALTPGYSLAIDKKWIPIGAPLWLTTTIPNEHNNDKKQFQRLMIAQDTGGAIKGLMRGDIFWGSGKKAAFLGENMKNSGHYWLLLPKQAFDRLASPFKNKF